MKRCPECRRDYYDDTLLFCLDDGNALLEGPATMDEPATAILSEPGAVATGFPASESPTRAQIHTTDQTAIFPRRMEAKPQENSSDLTERQSLSAHQAAKPQGRLGGRNGLLLGLALTALLLVGGFFGYRYFAPGGGQITSIAVLPFENKSGDADSGERASETMPQAKAYAKKAIELDGTLAEPHAALGLATWFFDWNKDEAEKEFKRAIELNPNYPTARHWYSRYLRGIGRTDEGFREIKRAEEIDPLSLIFINNVAEIYIDQGELDSAEREIKRTIELDPNFWAAYQTLVWVRVKQGRYDEALAAAQKSIELSNRSNAALAQLGHVYARLGRKTEAEAIIRELEARHSNEVADGRDLAAVYAGLDNKDKAVEWLEKAYQYRSFTLAGMKLEPLLSPLHGDPRWNDLTRRVGLPE